MAPGPRALAEAMAKFEMLKSVEGVKVNRRSGIPTSQRATISFGAIIEDPREERDALRFIHLGEMFDVPLSEIKGYYKAIEGTGALDAAPAAAPVSGRTVAPADTRNLRWESIPSSIATQRARVPGGWLVTAGGGLAFVPDAAHEWDGSSI